MPASTTRAFVDNAVEPHVRGFLHLPENANGSGLVLSHGAGSNAQAPLLVALAETFSATGFAVLRCDLPYRQSRSFGPPGPGDAARDRAGLKNAIAAMTTILGASLPAGVAGGGDFSNNEGAPLKPGFGLSGNSPTGRIFLGGHSYGGRQSSMLCSELAARPDKDEPDLVAGLLLLSYPLHPPRKPEQQRTQHLPDLRTPTLFVSGTRDPFGSTAEIERALKMIPAKTKLVPIEGAGHDLGFKGKGKSGELPEFIFSEFAKFFALSS